MANVPKKFWSPELDTALQAAADAFDLPSKIEFSKLEELSAHTVFDGLEVHAQAAISEGEKLFAPATVYVTLIYGEHDHNDEPLEFSDSFPARIQFSVDDKGAIQVLEIEVDTSSFFE